MIPQMDRSLQRHSLMRNLRLLLLVAAAGIVVTGLVTVARKSQNTSLRSRRRGFHNEDDFDQLADSVDDTVDDSFPASDPPSWNAGQKDHLH